MAVKTHIAKDGTRTYRVRVGRDGKLRTFREKDYTTRRLAKAAADKYDAELRAGLGVAKAYTCEQYAARCLDHWEQETMRSGRKRKRSSIDTMTASLTKF